MNTFKYFGLDNKAFYQGEDMLLSMGKAKEINSPSLHSYIQEGYKDTDFEQIQKVINYTVVRFIKTDKTFNNTIDTLKRWKYVRDIIKEYNTVFPDKHFNLKSFNRLREDIINELFK